MLVVTWLSSSLAESEAEESRMSAHVEEEHFAGSNKLSRRSGLADPADVDRDLPGLQANAIHFMLTILLGLSIIKAALIVAYFMHMSLSA